MVRDMLLPFYAFLDASGGLGQIESFTLVYAWPPTTDETLELFQRLPNIQELSISEGNEEEAKHYAPFFIAETFERLTEMKTDVTVPDLPPLLPHLRKLHLTCFATYPMESETCEAALQFLESRIPRLSRVALPESITNGVHHGALEEVRMELERSALSPANVRERLGKLTDGRMDMSGVKIYC
jgi:hypothetical protein